MCCESHAHGILMMPYEDKKGKNTNWTAEKKQQGCSDKQYTDLKRLLSLLNVPANKQQLPALKCEIAKNSSTQSQQQWIKSKNNGVRNQNQHISTEAVELEAFSVKYMNERKFSSHSQHKLFMEIFIALVKNRLICREWVERAPPGNFLRVLICLRLLMRDPVYQNVFHELGGVESLSQLMETTADDYLGYGEHYMVDHLVNMTNIFQKISAAVDQREWIVASEAHKTLVKCLVARDNNVLIGALLALTGLAESPECRDNIADLAVVENLLLVLQEYDLLSKRLAAELLRLLCAALKVREQLKVYEGIPVLLSLLHSDHLKLLWNVIWVLVQLCEDPESSAEIRIWGGIKQLLHILQGDRNFVSDRASIGSLSSANASGRIQQLHLSENLSPQEIEENRLSVQAACCAALTELVLTDTNAHQVVQENGVYIIAKFILPNKHRDATKTNLLQCYAFRALRFLFSMERNRHLFKRMFPPEMFGMFIDIGHYVRDISAYESLVIKLNSLPDEDLKQITENIESVNQNKAPTKFLGNYAILDHLGCGAFGSVYKVRKRGAQNCLAMKEVNLHNPAFGKDKKDRDKSVETIVSELTIINEQLCHPNVVHYYKTFIENDKLYIVMELIEGAPLGEHFNSLKEKQQLFTEERLWNIFIQICLALRYLHKEKRIVHRDLSPNNIMLGEKDKVTITDFGLAKQKQENSKLTSVVGTILYCCPEVMKSEPYGEKADVWATGCILYQMATLNPPFYSTSMLSLAKKIVEADYDPVPEGIYSEKVTEIINRCLTPDSEARPDIVEVSSLVTDVMMKYLDLLSMCQITLEKKLERERKRTQRYYIEANRNTMTCHKQCSLLSQEQCEKASLDSSSGVASFKSESSESPESPSEVFPAVHPKEEEKVPEDVFQDDNCSTEKDVCSEFDDDLDISDNYSSSSSSPCKDSSCSQSYTSSIPNGNSSPLSPSRAAVTHLNQHFQIHSFTSGSSGLTGRLKRSVSASGRETQRPAGSGDFASGSATRPRPASAGISVSQRKLRQISDPIQQILIQLHKIIYITQLPPALHHNMKRRVIERFKKSLFSPQSNHCNLKVEIKKLLQGSTELIETNVSTVDCQFLHHSTGGNTVFFDEIRAGISNTSGYEEGVTYEHLQTMIEDVLEDSGYYNAVFNRSLSCSTAINSFPAKR
ncbi:serine/threonine-protein kinase Nek10 [Protopterus annectens]|uniref:serine/threonine-protein kinase Nek10 n=1 Tax=Protopterus annectens TaxID=7888 RepID=UPI001CFA3989|nr:serine/threonine-protein kinase Nek10 [Protopterus annectens]